MRNKFDIYMCNTSAGELLAPEGIIRPVVSAGELLAPEGIIRPVVR